MVSTDGASGYGIPTEDEHYADPGAYERVFALVKSQGWESTASAVVFDFKDDGFSVRPRNTRETKSEAWVEVKNAKRLQGYMEDVSTAQCRAVALKPCLKCPSEAVGVVYTNGTLIYDCDVEKGIITFRKPLSELTDGGGAGGGG